MTRKLRVKRTTGISGKPVITIEHICGDYAEFTVEHLRSLAKALNAIADDIEQDRLRNNEIKEYSA